MKDRTKHKERMARKVAARASLHSAFSHPRRVNELFGIPANINRHTGKPHQHAREIARRLRQQARKA